MSRSTRGLAQLAHPTEADELFGRGYPNPDRVGCPPREVLVPLARRERPIGDPAYDHIKECSLVLLPGGPRYSRRPMRCSSVTWAAASVVALAAGTGAWILTARISSVDTEIQAQLDFRPHAIMRGETHHGASSNAAPAGARVADTPAAHGFGARPLH